MKNQKTATIILLFFTLFFVNTTEVDAQFNFGPRDTTYKSAAGLDATFINSFLPNPTSGGYFLHFMKYQPNNIVWKHAANLRFLGTITKNDINTDRNSTNIEFDYKFSRGKIKKIYDRLYFHYGPQFYVGYEYDFEKRISETTIDPAPIRRSYTHEFKAGVGPFLGLRFDINSRFSLYTEAHYMVVAGYNTEKTSYEHIEEEKENASTFSIVQSYAYPRAIVLFYHF